MIFFRPSRSKIILAFAYDRVNSNLYIRFRQTRERLYRYEKVPRRTVWEFLSADSAGSYFSRKIKNKFHCEMLDYKEFIKSI